MVQDEGNNLYDIPIQQLDLAANTIELLESVGITSIGDCLDFLERGAGATIIVLNGLIDAMYTDVVQKLKTHGYISRDWRR